MRRSNLIYSLMAWILKRRVRNNNEEKILDERRDKRKLT
jgi:hypothetical protein